MKRSIFFRCLYTNLIHGMIFFIDETRESAENIKKRSGRKMEQNIPVGISDFREIRENG